MHWVTKRNIWKENLCYKLAIYHVWYWWAKIIHDHWSCWSCMKFVDHAMICYWSCMISVDHAMKGRWSCMKSVDHAMIGYWSCMISVDHAMKGCWSCVKSVDHAMKPCWSYMMINDHGHERLLIIHDQHWSVYHIVNTKRRRRLKELLKAKGGAWRLEIKWGHTGRTKPANIAFFFKKMWRK